MTHSVQSERDLMLQSRSVHMQGALELALRAAPSELPILLRGETGTGKSSLAALIHERSRRSAGPLICVSCPTLPDSLLSAELFGHARGAFTGAVRDRTGRVEAARGGTLFLDEVGDMSSDLQAQLLRVLESQSFERLGENVERKTNVRVIAATHRDLEAEVRAGRFRLDLYYRLAVFDVHLPPLRQRREDIVTLARHLLARAARAAGVPAVEMTAEVERLLEQSELPGNVRELRNEMERALALCGAGPVQPSHLSERLRGASLPGPWVGGPFSLRELERAHIESVLARSSSYEEAAALLGIDDSTLWRKRRRLHLAVSKAS